MADQTGRKVTILPKGVRNVKALARPIIAAPTTWASHPTSVPASLTTSSHEGCSFRLWHHALAQRTRRVQLADRRQKRPTSQFERGAYSCTRAIRAPIVVELREGCPQAFHQLACGGAVGWLRRQPRCRPTSCSSKRCVFPDAIAPASPKNSSRALKNRTTRSRRRAEIQAAPAQLVV